MNQYVTVHCPVETFELQDVLNSEDLLGYRIVSHHIQKIMLTDKHGTRQELMHIIILELSSSMMNMD